MGNGNDHGGPCPCHETLNGSWGCVTFVLETCVEKHPVVEETYGQILLMLTYVEIPWRENGVVVKLPYLENPFQETSWET